LQATDDNFHANFIPDYYYDYTIDKNNNKKILNGFNDDVFSHPELIKQYNTLYIHPSVTEIANNAFNASFNPNILEIMTATTD
jgi:hypothetical protein